MSGKPAPAHSTLRFAPHMTFSLASRPLLGGDTHLNRPSVHTRTLKRNPVVLIGVGRGSVGRDNDPRLYYAQLRSNVTRKFALKGSVKVTIDDSCEGV
jgi:hypothetical protein